MPVTLSDKVLAVIGIVVVVVGVGSGIFHDQSIKGVYQSLSSTYSRDSNLTAQNQQLQNQLAALQGLPKVALVHGSVSTSRGTSIAIFFGSKRAQSQFCESPVLVRTLMSINTKHTQGQASLMVSESRTTLDCLVELRLAPGCLF